MQLEQQKFFYPNHADKITPGVCMRYTTDIEVDVTEKNISMQSSLYLGRDRSMIRECRDKHSFNYFRSKNLCLQRM